MIPIGKLLLTVFTSATVFGFWRTFRFVYHQFASPIRNLRGPNRSSWIHGNLRDPIIDSDNCVEVEWVKQYGNTLRFEGFLGTNRLFTVDTRAVHHILAHSDVYQKPPLTRYLISLIMNHGVLVVEGAQHHLQRRIMNPAFGPAQIRALTDIFLDKAIRLRDLWSSEIAKNTAGDTIGTRLNVMLWLNRATLDIIGLAGFNYDFDALNVDGRPNELDEALADMVRSLQAPTLFSVLQARFPFLRLIPTQRARGIQDARRIMARIGKNLLSDAKAAALTTTTEKGEIEKGNLQGRDLLSLLVKANMATDIPESQKLSDKSVLAQVPTFLVAGHETTSTATIWALYAITKAPEIQTKLREELLSVDTGTPSMDELMALPYLDAVVRETLRVHPPVPRIVRVALKDDIVPVEKPHTDKNGVIHNSIKINKGDPISISILAINRSEELWGPDAHEFRPERWENIPEAVSSIPGVWGHLLSFIGGPRACIGYRFSIVEVKALLFTLVRAFEFEFAVPVSDIGRKTTMVQRPVLRSDPESNPQLPLLLKPYKQT